jgi:hypothetical protein
MKLDDILSEWAKDSTINEEDIAGETVKSAILHSKYYEIFLKARIAYLKKQIKHDELIHIKTQYYLGELEKSELNEYGWKPFSKVVLKSEVHRYVNNDKDVVESTINLTLYKEKMEFLKDILVVVKQRGYIIKNLIDIRKFESGV